jgi:hypothetical protein
MDATKLSLSLVVLFALISGGFWVWSAINGVPQMGFGGFTERQQSQIRLTSTLNFLAALFAALTAFAQAYYAYLTFPP